jgi:hypothetical protein
MAGFEGCAAVWRFRLRITNCSGASDFQADRLHKVGSKWPRLKTQSERRNRWDFLIQASQIGRMNRTNMPDEYMLSDKAWAAIEPLLPEVYAGARRHDDRRICGGPGRLDRFREE